jgi:hypothetical protein
MRGRQGPADAHWPARRFWQLHFLGAYLVMLGWELLGQGTFGNHYYVSLLIPPMFLAFGSQLAPLLERLGKATGWLFAATIIAAWVATLLIPPVPSIPLFLRRDKALVAIALFTLGASAPLLSRRKTVLLLLLPASLGLGHFLSAQNLSGARMATPLTKSHYQAGIAGFEVIRSWLHDGDVWLWYDDNETPITGARRRGSVYRMIAGLHMWGFRLLNDEFPRVDDNWWEHPSIRLPTRIAVMTRRPNVLELAAPPLEQGGFRARILETREIPDDGRTFNLALIRVEFDDRRLKSTPSYVATTWQDWQPTGASPTVTRDVAIASTRILTNHSTYDWQLISRPLAVESHSGYLMRVRLAIDRGGAGIHVVGADRQTVVASRYWCEPSIRPVEGEIAFQANGHREVSIVISNCGETPTTSVFSVSKLELWEIKRGE